MSSRPRRNSGFTLVELLVVIGIIALLISILLPSLNSARRAASAVKCAAAMRDLGNAFQMYGVDNKGAWPVVRDLRNGKEDRWTGMLAKYVMTKKDAIYTDMGKLRNTVLWGCPEWAKSYEYSASAAAWTAENVYTGYSMNYYPNMPDSGFHGASEAKPGTLAYIDAASSQWGQYFKASTWGKKGSERALLADGPTSWIQASSSFSKRTAGLPGWDTLANSHLYVDASRHLRRGASKATAQQSKGLNMLFCDGHVAAVTPGEAWNAVRNPGQDKTTN